MALFAGGWATSQILILRHQRYIEPERRVSLGENILLDTSLEKRAGAKYFAQKNFDRAAKAFAKASQSYPQDPEARIYSQNALASNFKTFNIAVAVPIGKHPTVAQEILRGVAQAQGQANQNCDRSKKYQAHCGIRGRALAIKIVNDDNEPHTAQWLARELVKDRDILAVVGHNASDVSIAAAKVYRDRLVMISPTSFFADFPKLRKFTQGNPNYIFRTVPSLEKTIEHISQYIIREATNQHPKLLICYDSSAVNSKSHVKAFEQFQQQITLVKQPICDFNQPELDHEQVIEQAIANGADSLFLAPHVDRINEAVAIAKANYHRAGNGRLKLFSGSVLYTAKIVEDQQSRAAMTGALLNVFWHPNDDINHSYFDHAKKW